MTDTLTIGAVGRSGEGLQFAGRVLAEAAATAGYSPLLLPEPGLRARGDRSAFRLIVADEPALAAGDLDWLLACGPDVGDWSAPNRVTDRDRFCGQTHGKTVPASRISHELQWPQGAPLVVFGVLSLDLAWLGETPIQRALKELLPDHPRQVVSYMACFRAGRTFV